MSEKLANEESKWGPEFAEIQKQIPLREKNENRWHEYRLNGIYAAGVGIGTIVGAWSFRTHFADTSGISESVSHMPTILVIGVVIGSMITLAGGLLFSIGQILLNRSYREFDKTMEIILAKEKDKSSLSTNSPNSERF